MAMSSAISRVSCNLFPSTPQSGQRQPSIRTYSLTPKSASMISGGEVSHPPFVVLLWRQHSSLYELVQQVAQMSPGLWAALQRRLHAAPYEHKEQRGTVQLRHTLQRLLQFWRGIRMDASVSNVVWSFLKSLRVCRQSSEGAQYIPSSH